MIFKKKPVLSDKFQKLSSENDKMLHQIEAMITKINALEIKTDELSKIISELKSQRKHLIQTIEKLEELHVEKEDLIKIAAHDIKNPAGTITNLVGLLESFDLTAQEQQEIHMALINISNKIVKIVDDVVDSVKNSKGLFELKLTANDFNTIVQEIVDRYTKVALDKKITLTVKLDNTIPPLSFDKEKIEEVIENLINNAIKFTTSNCKVEVVSSIEKNFVILEVKDNGPGLTAADAKKAFGKEVRLSNLPTGGESSTGLGLWIVRKFVEKHNGKVWIKSKKGFGSTFAFKIPINQKLD